MNFLRPATRVALIAWAFYLTVALTAFAMHSHASHEVGGPSCALCIGHNTTSAVAVVAAIVLAAPTLYWILRLWLVRVQNAFVASIARTDDSRGPPMQVFLFTQNWIQQQTLHETS